MFNKCDFLIGDDKSVVVVVPQAVPKGEQLTIRISDDVVSFYKAGEILFGRVECACVKTLRCLRKKQRVGLIEALDGKMSFPVYIAATAKIVTDIRSFAEYETRAA